MMLESVTEMEHLAQTTTQTTAVTTAKISSDSADTDISLTTNQVADRLGLTTSELSELRLSHDNLPIEREGFRVYYLLKNVKAFEQYETLKVFERVLAAERPLVLLRQMAAVGGLTRLKIGGKQVQPLVQSPEQSHVQELSANQLDIQVETAVCTKAEVIEPKPRPKPLDGTYPWYVVHTKPRQELLALENLERQGYCCYLPQLKHRRSKARKLVIIEEPMFPRYLFIGADAAFHKKGTSYIRSTKGVHELVRFGSEPAQIHFELLNGIFEREQAQHDQPTEPFQTGDCVRVIDGPLAGLESIYQAQTGEERSMILLKLLNRPVKVQVATAQLRKTA